MCRSCLSTALEPVLDFGLQPSSDLFPLQSDPSEDPLFPLVLMACRRCRLVQLGTAPTLPEAPVLAVESGTMTTHAGRVANEVVNRLGIGAGSTVIEVDSHHGGSWMSYLAAAGAHVSETGERADVLIDNHALPHEPDLDAALAAHRARLRLGGRLVLEFHHLLPLVQQGQFDTIRHGHWTYLSLLALGPALARHGFVLTQASEQPVYGGSLLVIAKTSEAPDGIDSSVSGIMRQEEAGGLGHVSQLRRLQQQARTTCAQLHRYLAEAKAANRVIVGYGAPSKAAVLLTMSGVTPRLLPFTADLSPAKRGRRLPGSRIPIRAPQEVIATQPDEVLILTWDIAPEVIRQLKAAGIGKETVFVVPVPHVSRLA